MNYCTAAEARERMGHAGAHSVDLEQRLAAAVPTATQMIRDEAGRDFASVAGTRTYHTPGHTRVLHLPDDVTAITSLKIDDNDDGVFETTVTEYELDQTVRRTDWPFSIVRLLRREFPSSGHRMVRVEITGTFGWASVPDPINQACSLLASRIAQRPSHALFGTETFGDLGAAGIRSTDPDVARMIAPYRRMVAA